MASKSAIVSSSSRLFVRWQLDTGHCSKAAEPILRPQVSRSKYGVNSRIRFTEVSFLVVELSLGVVSLKLLNLRYSRSLENLAGAGCL